MTKQEFIDMISENGEQFTHKYGDYVIRKTLDLTPDGDHPRTIHGEIFKTSNNVPREMCFKINDKHATIDECLNVINKYENEVLDSLIGKIHNIDCIKGMEKLPDNCVDLVVTSCPYNVNIAYDTYVDNLPIDDYFNWCEEWLSEIYRTLKDDGRISLNIPYEINVRERGGRIFMASEFWQIMKKVGFKFFGIVDLEESSPHRSKTTAWGSWMSPAGPYIYNPKECVILAYKNSHIKNSKGVAEWGYEEIIVKNEEGTDKKKRIYSDSDKNEFMELVFGQWKYMADTQSLTKATFSLDIPSKAIKILSFKDDVIMDPFSGSGTTCLSAEILGRKWIGFELSKNYTEVAMNRINDYKNNKNTLFINE